MCYKNTNQQVYMFDEQSKQQWHSFLEQKAIDLNLTSTQTRVFLSKFKYDNWHKNREDVGDEDDDKSFEAFVSRIKKVIEEFETSAKEIYHQKSKPQMYVFDEDFKQRWYSFLEQKAIKLGLTAAQTRVFLARFKYDSWNKKIEDICSENNFNNSDTFRKHSTPIFNKLKPSCPGIGRGAGNDSIARRCLLEEFKLIYFPNSSELN